MKTSPTLEAILKEHEQNMLMRVLKSTDHETWGRGINAVGPNEKYPLPWITDKFPNMNSCSIISVGGEVNETVVTMIDCDTAEQVMAEIYDE